MKAIKLGKIEFSNKGRWQAGGVITPTPYVLNDQIIRVFTGFRDLEGVARIGYIDVDALDPTKVIKVSKKPVLDIGSSGCFDDNGMIIGDIKEFDGKIYLFYVGFQLVKKAKFLAFSGLAVSSNNGENFERISKTPILDRSSNASTIKAIHSVNIIHGQCYAYYAVGDGWEIIDSIPYPQYESYCSKLDLNTLVFTDEKKCIANENDEYRIGKPTVYETLEGYMMFYTRGIKTDLKYYEPGVATSNDGCNWDRQDVLYPISKGPEVWDSINMAYPKIIENHASDQYVFYSGNGMGSDGFGVAKIIDSPIIYKQSLVLE